MPLLAAETIQALHDRIVIRRLEGEEKTKAGIIIPDTASRRWRECPLWVISRHRIG